MYVFLYIVTVYISLYNRIIICIFVASYLYYYIILCKHCFIRM